MIIITPTNGRIVWFTPPVDQSLWPKGMVWLDPAQKLAAQVCHVHSPGMVNLLVTDSEGKQFPFTSVDLAQTAGELYSLQFLGRYAEWMPYQKGQAAKHEAKGA